MSDRSADVRPWRLHCNAVGSCFLGKDLQALRRAERRSAQGQRRWPVHAAWRRAQLCGPMTGLKSGEPIHAQKRRIIEVARTRQPAGPRLFVPPARVGRRGSGKVLRSFGLRRGQRFGLSCWRRGKPAPLEEPPAIKIGGPKRAPCATRR
jgi:hypothetical protein